MTIDYYDFMRNATAAQIGLPAHRTGLHGAKDHITATFKRVFSRPEFFVFGTPDLCDSWRLRRKMSRSINSLVGWTPFKKITYSRASNPFETEVLTGKRVIMFKHPGTHALEVVHWNVAEGVERCFRGACLSYCYIPRYSDSLSSKQKAQTGVQEIGIICNGIIERGALFNPYVAKKNPEYRNYFKLVGEKLLYGPQGRNHNEVR